jgi:hypothetical protein
MIGTDAFLQLLTRIDNAFEKQHSEVMQPSLVGNLIDLIESSSPVTLLVKNDISETYYTKNDIDWIPLEEITNSLRDKSEAINKF